jgi:hypothetical protein
MGSCMITKTHHYIGSPDTSQSNMRSHHLAHYSLPDVNMEAVIVSSLWRAVGSATNSAGAGSTISLISVLISWLRLLPDMVVMNGDPRYTIRLFRLSRSNAMSRDIERHSESFPHQPDAKSSTLSSKQLDPLYTFSCMSVPVTPPRRPAKRDFSGLTPRPQPTAPPPPPLDPAIERALQLSTFEVRMSALCSPSLANSLLEQL